MSEDELHQLLRTTEAAKDFVSRRCGIRPADRAMLYAVGVGTGFRRAALLSLAKASFHLAANLTRPFVRLAAADNKKRKDRYQPIRRDLAERLRAWLAGRPEGPVWRPSKHADLSLRFRRDMEAARAAWIAAAPGAAERARRQQSNFLKYSYHDGVRAVFCDFHGLRHTGITFVVRHAGLRVGQIWADHRTPVLTARYAHLDLVDEAEALEGLPAAAAGSVEARQLARGSEKSGTVRKKSDRKRTA